MLEVQHGGPIIAEILAHFAGSTGAALADVARHGGIEGIAADDVVDVGGRCVSGFDDGIEARGYEGGAAEAETGVDAWGDEGEGAEERLHNDGSWQ